MEVARVEVSRLLKPFPIVDGQLRRAEADQILPAKLHQGPVDVHSGHSGGVSKIGLGDRELATLDLAACLSQVGKIFVPQAILTKAGQLDEPELRIMRRHVEHALEVIGPIDFDLPIGEAIGQMYEHLDGSGYPKGLRGEQIGPLARILGVVDVFCALTETRAYRDQLSAGKALMHLDEHAHVYDAKVVAALAEVIAAEGAPEEATLAAARDGARSPVAAA